MLIAIFVVKFGNLDVTSAYLATSPGGLNVVVGLPPIWGPMPPSCSPIRWSGLHHHPYGSPRRPDFAQIPELRREKEGAF